MIFFLIVFDVGLVSVVVALAWTDILQPPLWLVSSPLFPVSILSLAAPHIPFPARLCASYRLGGCLGFDLEGKG